MSEQNVLVTGANGEIGHLLLEKLASEKKYLITALDISDIDPALNQYVNQSVKADITDISQLENIFQQNQFDIIYHLAALLSTSGEKQPELAHKVNVNGTFDLLQLANNYSSKYKKSIIFVFPSSIAVYGFPDIQSKVTAGSVKEKQYNQPITMYGINKLYCERLGIYFEKYYKLLESPDRLLDFRCLRFPGLISAITVPSGGTSDYAPEMIHTAAQGRSYESFVREDSVLPFMAMPDAVKALVDLSKATKNKLSQNVYNVGSFSIAAKEIANIVLKVFPDTAVSYDPDTSRQRIVDSWPQSIDDSQARADWDWKPDYDLARSFEEYLIPQITKKYQK